MDKSEWRGRYGEEKCSVENGEAVTDHYVWSKRRNLEGGRLGGIKRWLGHSLSREPATKLDRAHSYDRWSLFEGAQHEPQPETHGR